MERPSSGMLAFLFVHSSLATTSLSKIGFEDRPNSEDLKTYATSYVVLCLRIFSLLAIPYCLQLPAS
eukprot:2700698-Amphidinium_carterae.2